MINIVNKRFHKKTIDDVYCGRGSALGNPFHINAASDRNDACDKFDKFLLGKVELNKLSGQMKAQLNLIYTKAKSGDVNLVCYCYPKRCHCETIKSLIESKLTV